ncbi:hypothetical protein [Hyalangium sp.]|uniref:hypothetical protein n=1 Tax=Hyalangium sp. TaxID=2028555 RepID=UPI002D3CDE9F|nr:hypothetical protein [Hyalangium sp.]HYH94835.1 hypothetical protein [Hyalangium sp.]
MRPNLLPLLVLLSACASSRSSSSGEAVSSPPAPASTAPAPVLASGLFGTEHPFVLQAVSPEGRWLIACQAREDTTGDGKISVAVGHHGNIHGDKLEQYLFLEPGPGERIDDFISADRKGRFIVVVRGSSLRLIDTQAGTERELAPLQPNDRERDDALLPPPIARFSRDGRLLLFLRKEAGKVVAIVRELASGREQVVDAGTGELRRAWLEPSGAWALFQVLVEDTDKDGTLRWPVERTSLAPARCRGPVMSFSRSGWKGDIPVARIRRVEEGPLYEGKDVLGPVGPSMLRRGAQGELLVEDASGRQTEWVPAACKGRVLHADAERQLLVVACTAAGNDAPAPVELHGASIHQPLGLSVESPFKDNLFEEPSRFVQLNRATPIASSLAAKDLDPQLEEETFIVDLEQRTRRPVLEELESMRGTWALLSETLEKGEAWDRRKTRVSLLNLATGAQTVLAESQIRSDLTAGPLVLSSGVLVDLDAGRMLGQISEPAGSMLALDSQGRVLRSSAAASEKRTPIEGIPWGPVRWEPLLTR